MKLRIVEVVWDDHAFYQGSYDGEGLALQRTVGYVVRETKKVLVVAQSWQKQDTKWYETLVLDKRTIRSVKEVA